jgi:RNA polymerase sigma-70 factor, ECF subfamily
VERAYADDDAFASVVAAARVGADWALTSLYRQFQPALVRYLRARSRGNEEDLASEVWLDVAIGLGRFEGGREAFRRRLFTIARRRVIDLDKKHRRRNTGAVDTAAFDDVAGRAIDPATAAVDLAAGDEAAALIASVLAPAQAEVVLLRVVAGLDVAAVAEIVGRSPAAVSVLQHRALRRLARIVEDRHGDLVGKK